MYKTDLATDDEIRNWNNIVSRCEYSEALHTLEWREALRSSFRQLEPVYFIIRDENNNVAGALPCFVFRPMPAVKMLLSMPWTLPGGPLIFQEANIEEATLSAIETLEKASFDIHSFETTITLPVNCGCKIISGVEFSGYIKNSDSFTHVLDISEGYDAVWNNYNKRVRGAVRKAQKTGVIVKETENESEMMDFYKLYLVGMTHFNSTPKPYNLLRYLQTSSIARLVVAQLENQIIGGLLFLHFNSSVRLWCEASDSNFLSYRPNNAVIDYIVQWACEHRYTRVDFGASPIKSEGLIAFKEEWRAQRKWLYTFTKIFSSRKRKIWISSEPMLRRLYGTIQKFRIRI
jgi:hypothetical protein